LNLVLMVIRLKSNLWVGPKPFYLFSWSCFTPATWIPFW